MKLGEQEQNAPSKVASCPIQNWFVIHTKPRQEVHAERVLLQAGIETFFPRLRQRRRRGGIAEWWIGPLFPNYLFVRCDLNIHFRMVRYARGVTSIVSFGEKPTVVDDRIVDKIKSRSKENIVEAETDSYNFQHGEQVLIEEGPFRGLRAIFEGKLSGVERVAVLLTTLGLQPRLELPVYALRRV